MLPSSVPEVSVGTVNRKLAAVSSFYAHQARNGEGPGDLLAAWRTGGRGGWKPFLHHVSKGKPYRGRAITLKAPKKLPRVLTVAETQAILDACTRLRDRFFFTLMHETGCRAGEVLGLRHEDIAAAECEVSIVPRENANGARAKSGGRTVPVGPELIRLYADYLHEEYGGTDSDYVFVISGRNRRARRGPIGPSVTSSCGCGRRPAWISTRTGSATRRRPGGCATACPSRLSPSFLATHQ